MRRLLGSFALFALASCASFVPAYQADIDPRLGVVKTDIAKVQAVLTVTQHEVDFAAAQPYYTDALANLAVAQKLAEDQAASSKLQIAGVPAAAISTSIANCTTAVTNLMAANRTRALVAEDFKINPV